MKTSAPGQRSWFLRLAAALFLVTSMVLGYQAWQSRESLRVVVEWSTASELDLAGFNVFRGESPGGPFEKMNQALIPPADDPLTGGDYAFADENVNPGKTYHYRLEEIGTSGNTIQHGPIQAEAKRGGTLEGVLALLSLAGGLMIFLLSIRESRGEVKKGLG